VARIYGRSDNELEIVSDAPDHVEKFEEQKNAVRCPKCKRPVSMIIFKMDD